MSTSPLDLAPYRSILVLVAALTACGDDGSGEDATTNLPTLPPATDGTGTSPGTTQDLPTGDASMSGTEGMAGSTGGGTTSLTGGPTTATTGVVGTGDTGVSSGADDTTAGVLSTGGEESTGGSTGMPIDMCKVSDDMDAVVPCTDEAPPNSFEPDIQWAWPGQDGDTQVAVTPVVANLTDDNGDGEIDLCDIPDIVVPAYPGPGYLNFQGNLYVLDGATGAVHYKVANIGAVVYPAIADIDNDGLPEILTARPNNGGSDGWLVALEHDGTEKWISQTMYAVGSSAIAVADIDHDGDVEIVHHGYVFDHNGALLWQAPNPGGSYVNTIADLDGDDNMEIILGPTAYRHDGALYYNVPQISDGHPQVADLDADGQPEVLVVTTSGLSLIEHDGTLTYSNMGGAIWQPAAIHDFDGDMAPEIAAGSGNAYRVLETNLMAKWSAPVQDGSGYASSTAFDFLGDGTAEAMYADEVSLFIFDGNGQPYMTTPRGSWTQWEMPIVVDVDNDASAEIVVVSNLGYNNSQAAPVQVVRDKMDRWVPARRIWNQHTYHVTNVREDGTIPQFEPKSWQKFNTFRTQAQIASGGVCLPDPQ